MRQLTTTFLLCLLIPTTGMADGRPFLGFFFGVGGVTPTDEFYKRAGNGLTTGRDGLVSGSSVVREASGHATAWTLGAMGGYELFPLLAVEGRSKLLLSTGGGATHYFRGTQAIIGQEDAGFSFTSGSVDVGPRICLGKVCAYPFVGLQTSANYRFSFGVDGSYSDSEVGVRRLMGLQALVHLPVGANKIPAFDIGVEYEQFPSSLGGNTSLYLITFGMDFSLTKASK